MIENKFDNLFAHMDQKDPKRRQRLISHLINTAEESRKIGEKVGLGNLCYIVGVLHDIGKIKEDFQNKLKGNSCKKVDHSSLGGVFILKLLNDYEENYDSKEWDKLNNIFNADEFAVDEFDYYNNILIYSIMSHHRQYNMVRKNKDGEYIYTNKYREIKEKKENKNLDEDFICYIKYLEKNNIFLKDIYIEGFKEYLKIMKKLKNLTIRTSEKKLEAFYFYKTLLIRLVVSILKSSDIKDSINSYEKIIKDEDLIEKENLIKKFEENINRKYQSFGKAQTKINKIRNKISNKIFERSKEDTGGIYRLNLPTGAGKTLLSLRYGINQMRYQTKERFIYVTSYLSVLEQNASEIKTILNNDDYVLEHHSNVIEYDEKSYDEDDDSFESIRKKYLLDDWSSPVILTTMVQFFNSVLKGKSSNLTRFKSLINSVIILDELQSLPTEVIYLTNLFLNFMKVVMNSNIVLSTATQPIYDDINLKHRLDYGDAFNKNTDIISLTGDDEKTFERVKLKLYKNPREEYSIEDLKYLILENKDKSTLIILNTKSVVKKLYELIEEDYSEKDLYYLTTNLTAYHRLEKIAEIKNRLKAGDKICVVSTQLIEAGVDVDFDFVVRSLTGMDSIIQAMGRCNREGKKEEAFTYIIKLHKEIEKTSMLKGIDDRKMACDAILDEVKKEQNIEKLVNDYFGKLYANLKEKDLIGILNLLSLNKNVKEEIIKFCKNNPDNPYISCRDDKYVEDRESPLGLNLFQSFKEAYDGFQLIDNSQKTAAVMYKETEDSINRIRCLEDDFKETYNMNILKEIKKLIKFLSRHTVVINEKDLTYCENILDGMIYVVPEIYYSKKFGLDFENTSGLLSH